MKMMLIAAAVLAGSASSARAEIMASGARTAEATCRHVFPGLSRVALDKAGGAVAPVPCCGPDLPCSRPLSTLAMPRARADLRT